MAVILLLIIFIGHVNGLVLKQVFILSRHNIRAPLTANFEQYTPLEWTKFSTPTAHLTPKGALIEGYIADSISNWLKKEKLLEEPCPSDTSVLILANAPQRTVKTAKAFAKSAFKECNVPVVYRDDVKMDPIFNPVIRNLTKSFKEAAKEDMQKKLDTSNIKDAYKLIEDILEFNHSKICRTESFCDLVDRKNDIVFETGEEPNVYGPLSIGNSITDVFLMSYYEGLPMEDVAWGKLTEADHWKIISKITKENLNVRFNSTNLAKDVAQPLIGYMKNVFLNVNAPKLTVLFGHDSNLYSVMTFLNFKSYELPNQIEKTPIGGKLVFQKWYDENLDRYLLKINYVYPSVHQLRTGKPFTKDNPLHSVVLSIAGCDIDDKGFCPWQDFLDIFKTL